MKIPHPRGRGPPKVSVFWAPQKEWLAASNPRSWRRWNFDISFAGHGVINCGEFWGEVFCVILHSEQSTKTPSKFRPKFRPIFRPVPRPPKKICRRNFALRNFWHKYGISQIFRFGALIRGRPGKTKQKGTETKSHEFHPFLWIQVFFPWENKHNSHRVLVQICPCGKFMNWPFFGLVCRKDSWSDSVKRVGHFAKPARRSSQGKADHKPATGIRPTILNADPRAELPLSRSLHTCAQTHTLFFLSLPSHLLVPLLLSFFFCFLSLFLYLYLFLSVFCFSPFW